MTTTKKTIISVLLSLLIVAVLASGVAVGIEPLLQKYGKRTLMLFLSLSPLYLIPKVREIFQKSLFSRFSDFEIFLLPLATYLMASELSLLWAQKIAGNNYTVAGVIPLVDSKDYFQGAIGLNDFGTLHEWAGRRPLNHLFFGGLFFWSGENHFLMFSLLTFLIVLGTNTFAKNIYRRVSKVGAFYIPLSVYYFYREYTGSFLSEGLGLIMSLVSINFLFLVRGEKDKDSLLPLCFSLIALCVGLNARAGNFFAPFGIVACYLIWGKFDLKKIQVAVLLFITLVMGMSFNKITRFAFSIEGSATSNLWYTIYGVARGGEGWTKFSQDFPKLNQLAGKAHLEAVKRVTFESIKKDPLLFVKGCFVGFKVFVTRYLTFLPSKFKFLEAFLVVLAFFFFLRKKLTLRKLHPFYCSVSFVFLTNILTSPLLALDGQQRVYAATITYVMLAFSLGFLFFNNQREEIKYEASLCLNKGYLFFVLLILFSPLFFSEKMVSAKEFVGCEGGQEVIFKYRKQYSLEYRGNEKVSERERPQRTDKQTMKRLVPGTNLEGINYDLFGDETYTLFPVIDIKKKAYSLRKLANFPEGLQDGFYQFCLDGTVLNSYQKL